MELQPETIQGGMLLATQRRQLMCALRPAKGHNYFQVPCRLQVVVRDGRAITAGVPDYRQLDFAPLPPPLAGLVPNGIVAPRPTDRLLEGEDAAAQAALDVQVTPASILHELLQVVWHWHQGQAALWR